jgi:Ca2+/H+ antiporter, TMEM165/GDT1 family
MVAMAIWTLKPDKLGEGLQSTGHGAFFATLIAFFIAEIGDKTQIATIALAAGYSNLTAVVAGTTTGMMIANTPIVFAGYAFAERLPMRVIHYVASGFFAILGIVFIGRAVAHWSGL